MCQLCIDARESQVNGEWASHVVGLLEEYESSDPEPKSNEKFDGPNDELMCVHAQVRLLRDLVIYLYRSKSQ
jgi:hypothetical protein